MTIGYHDRMECYYGIHQFLSYVCWLSIAYMLVMNPHGHGPDARPFRIHVILPCWKLVQPVLYPPLGGVTMRPEPPTEILK